MSDVAAAPQAAPVEASGVDSAPAGNENAEPSSLESSSPAQGGENALEAAQPEPEPKPAERYKVKVAGQEREVTIDDLRKRYERDEGAAHRFEEAARMRKEAEAKEKAFSEDPVGFLMKAGRVQEARQLAEKLILEQIEEERLTPEQRRIRELESKLKERESAEEAARREQEEAAIAKQEQEYSQRLVGDLKAAFQSNGLPLDDSLHLTNVVRVLQNARAAGEDMPVAEAVEFARYEVQERTSQFLSALPPEQLLDFLGPQILQKIRQADLAKIKKQPQQETPASKESAVPQSGSAKAVKSAEAFFDSL